jgi:hypothetical protein
VNLDRKSIISLRIADFLSTSNPIHLLAAIALVISQGRVLEVTYGLYCIILFRPGKIRLHNPLITSEILAEAELLTIGLREQMRATADHLAKRLSTDDVPRGFLIQGFTAIQHGLVVGEYDENSSRIYLLFSDSVSMLDPYSDDPGVRHIHLVHNHGGRLFVATGDSKKYLDEFYVEDRKLIHVMRWHRYFGGFTAGCTVGARLYLGTDFSGRPNYIERIDTGQKFCFPPPSYNQFCLLMLNIQDRYIFCLNASLSFIEDRKSISIFDTATSEFIFSQSFTADELPSYTNL